MNKIPQLKIRLLATVVTCAMALCFAISASAQDLTIRFAWYMPPHTATAMQGNAIADNIEKLSDGKIKVQTYPSGSLLDASNQGPGIANGTVNMGIGAMHWWAGRAPALEWDTIPFLVEDAGQLLQLLHGQLGEDVNKIFHKQNIQIVGWGFYGYAKSYINSKHAIKTPADLKGLKLRSEGKLSSRFLKQQGATPLAMDSSEVYTALQRGTLDGAVSGLSSFISRKWYEVAHHITAIHYTPLVYPLQVNLKWWKGLTQQQRDIIKKAAAEAEQSNLKEIEHEFKHDKQIAKKAGVDVYQPTGENLKKWKQATFQLAKKNYLAHTGAQGKKLMHDFQQAAGD